MDDDNIFNKLPNEIILKIIYNIDNIGDLINIYESSNNFKNLINKEIIKYFNEKNCSEFYKYFDQSDIFEDTGDLLVFFDNCFQRKYLYVMIIGNNKLDSYMIDYLENYNEDIKNDNLIKIQNLYSKHIIYKIVLDSILYCSICKINNLKKISLYKCFNCHKYICNECCIKCKECNIYKYDNGVYYHCKYCKNKCFNNILEDLKNINFENTTKKYKDIKDILLVEYTNRIDLDDIDYIEDHDFIDELILKKEIKSIIKKYSNEINVVII